MARVGGAPCLRGGGERPPDPGRRWRVSSAAPGTPLLEKLTVRVEEACPCPCSLNALRRQVLDQLGRSQGGPARQPARGGHPDVPV